MSKSIKPEKQRKRPPRKGEGRPSKYNDINISLEQVEKLAGLGLRYEEMADFMGISRTAFCSYISKHEEFANAVKKGVAKANATCVQSLFKKCNGYSHPEEKIFMHEGQPVVVPTTKHYPPDTGALAFWLKCRAPHGWREKQYIELEATLSMKDLAKSFKEMRDENEK